MGRRIIQCNFKLFLEIYKLFYLPKFWKTFNLVYNLEGPCSFYSFIFFSCLFLFSLLYFEIIINHSIIPFFGKRSPRKGQPCFLKIWHWQTTFSTYSLGYAFASWLFSQSAWNRCSCLKTLLYVFIWGSLLLQLIHVCVIRVEAVYCSWVYGQGSEEYIVGNR